MNFENANLFIQKMREDIGFRKAASNFEDSEALWNFLMGSGFEFNSCDLIKAIAACMAEADQMSQINID